MSGGVGPRVHRVQESTGTMLMERVQPGTPLSQAGLSEDSCWEVVWNFARELAQLDPSGMMPVIDFVDSTHPRAQELLETPEMKEILARAVKPSLAVQTGLEAAA